MKNIIAIILFLPMLAFSQAPYIHNVYDTNSTATVDAHVVSLVGGGPTNGMTRAQVQQLLTTNAIPSTNLTGTIQTANLPADVARTTQNNVWYALNAFNGNGLQLIAPDTNVATALIGWNETAKFFTTNIPSSLLPIGTNGYSFRVVYTNTDLGFVTTNGSLVTSFIGTNNFSGGGGGGGSGTVTSVAMTVPSILSISGSPITTAGTFGLTLSGTPFPNAVTATTATNRPDGTALNTLITPAQLSTSNFLTALPSGLITNGVLTPWTNVIAGGLTNRQTGGSGAIFNYLISPSGTKVVYSYDTNGNFGVTGTNSAPYYTGNGGGLTNTEFYTVATTTNVSTVFDGRPSVAYTITNGPGFKLTLSGTNGHAIYYFVNPSNVVIDPFLTTNQALRWMGGSSNGVATNGATLTIDSFQLGGTNRYKAYLAQP